ncbi:MAG: hypothetical protein HYW38_01730 [Candidatus Colwellbacteria bacterium]|nr:hypothetical protein [Candidatus Colwellbacteria bacterium]
MKRNDKDIIKKLQALRQIGPGTIYARNSRRLILASKNALFPQPSIFSRAAQSLNFAFETALLAALFLVVILGGVFGLSKSLFLPPLQGIDEKALLTEADAINRDISLKLEEIAYFGNHKTSTERVVALDAKRIKFEREELPITETATDKEIDKLLNQVINY